MGCQNSKEEQTYSKHMPLNLEQIRKEANEKNELKYQKILRKLENYIKSEKAAKSLIANEGISISIPRSLFLLSFEVEFNNRNKAKIYYGASIYSRHGNFYPSSDEDVNDPHFV